MPVTRILALTLGLSLAALAHAPGLRAQEAPTPAPPAQEPAKPDADAKAAPEPPANLRIRGEVEAVDAGGVMVQLSKGISLRVDLDDKTPILSAARITLADMQPGADLRVRTRTGTMGVTVAGDVLVVEAPKIPAGDLELGELTTRGALKAIEKAEQGQVLVLTEKGTDRRLAVSQQTTFWRLNRASITEIKPGVSLSVVIVRQPDGSARPERAVFGATPPGTLLPL